MYWRRPSAAEVADIGLRPEDYNAPEDVELWPDNWPPISLFQSIRTQWRMGQGGPIGLDYNVVYQELERAGISGGDYDDMMHAIRIIENAALDEMYNER